jgi:phosphoenolpyruvate carboxylase
MLDKKLARIRELLDLKEKTDSELAQILGESDAPVRGRPRKKEAPSGESASGGEQG